MPHRIVTPTGHGDETIQIALDMIPSDYELVQAPHGTPEFWNALKDAEFYIGLGQFKHVRPAEFEYMLVGLIRSAAGVIEVGL